MRRVLRYLRIAWTAACIVVCVLLIVFWVRSHSWLNSWLRTAPNSALYIGLFEGEWKVIKFPHRYPSQNNNAWYPGQFSAEIVEGEKESHPDNGDPRNWAFIGPLAPGMMMSVSYHVPPIAVIPMWAILFVAATLAAVPWIRWTKRFSLRTLLIAMTLVAVALGVIVASR